MKSKQLLHDGAYGMECRKTVIAEHSVYLDVIIRFYRLSICSLPNFVMSFVILMYKSCTGKPQ